MWNKYNPPEYLPRVSHAIGGSGYGNIYPPRRKKPIVKNRVVEKLPPYVLMVENELETSSPKK